MSGPHVGQLNFSLKIGSIFSFSLEARDKGLALDAQEDQEEEVKPTLGRNARRQETFMLRKKGNKIIRSEH